MFCRLSYFGIRQYIDTKHSLTSLSCKYLLNDAKLQSKIQKKNISAYFLIPKLEKAVIL